MWELRRQWREVTTRAIYQAYAICQMLAKYFMCDITFYPFHNLLREESLLLSFYRGGGWDQAHEVHSLSKAEPKERRELRGGKAQDLEARTLPEGERGCEDHRFLLEKHMGSAGKGIMAYATTAIFCEDTFQIVSSWGNTTFGRVNEKRILILDSTLICSFTREDEQICSFWSPTRRRQHLSQALCSKSKVKTQPFPTQRQSSYGSTWRREET